MGWRRRHLPKAGRLSSGEERMIDAHVLVFIPLPRPFSYHLVASADFSLRRFVFHVPTLGGWGIGVPRRGFAGFGADGPRSASVSALLSPSAGH